MKRASSSSRTVSASEFDVESRDAEDAFVWDVENKDESFRKG